MPISDIRGAWITKLTGIGFSYYRAENRLMEDDGLIRGRSCASLDATLAKLRAVESAFRRRYLPPPSREKPFPDAERVAEVREIVAFRERVAALEVRIRNAAMPPADGTWNRHRDHEATLSRLADADIDLIGNASDLEAAVNEVTESTILSELDGVLAQRVTGLTEAIKKREAILTQGLFSR